MVFVCNVRGDLTNLLDKVGLLVNVRPLIPNLQGIPVNKAQFIKDRELPLVREVGAGVLFFTACTEWQFTHAHLQTSGKGAAAVGHYILNACTKCFALFRRVGIIDKTHRGCVLSEHGKLLVGPRTAQGGYNIEHAHRVHFHRVGRALHKYVLLLAHGLAVDEGLVAVYAARLVIYLTFGAIHILCGALPTEVAGGKSYYITPRIPNGVHKAVAHKVIKRTLLLVP